MSQYTHDFHDTCLDYQPFEEVMAIYQRNSALTEDELRSLLDTMIEKKVTPTCPHGRPLVVAISHYELDKKFKRIQK